MKADIMIGMVALTGVYLALVHALKDSVCAVLCCANAISLSIKDDECSFLQHYASHVPFVYTQGTYLIPSEIHCTNVPENQVCSRPDLFAFQVGSGIAIFFVAILGFWTWHVSRRVHWAVPATPEGRLFAHLPEGEILAAVNLTFQVWDFVMSLVIPEHCTPM